MADEDLRQWLINRVMSDGDYDKRGPVIRAVDRYIEDQEAKWHHDTNDLDACVDYIRMTDKYWE